MKLKHTFILFFLVVLFVSCTTDSEYDLTDNTPINQPVMYTETVSTIMNFNCNFCHGAVPSNGAYSSLNTYENVRNSVLNGALIQRISNAQGSAGMMPDKGTRMPQSTIDKIIKWKNDGFLK